MNNIFAMILANGIHIAGFSAGALLILLGCRSFRKAGKISPKQRAALGDGILIDTAIAEVGEDSPKVAYLKVSILMSLERLTETYLRAQKLRNYLGAVYLIAGFFSIAITGTDASIPGLANTVKFSFAVNIVGEIASGFLIFGGFEAKAGSAYELAMRLRLEVSQFIAQSAEYYRQPPEERWRLFTHSCETLLLNSLAPAQPQKKDEREEENSEN
jgi:hypothetical protein